MRKKYFPLLFLFATLIAISRLYLGVHTIVDVTAGFALSIVLIFLFDHKAEEGSFKHKIKHKKNNGHYLFIHEFSRQFLHMLIGSFYFIILFINIPVFYKSILIIIPLYIGVILYFLKSINKSIKFVDYFLQFFERPKNQPGLGALALFTGIALCIVMPNNSFALATLYTLTVPDSLATIIGKSYGKHKLSFNKNKSAIGSLAFFISSLPVIIVLGPIIGILFSITMTFTESFFSIKNIDDNIMIPLAGYLFLLLSTI